MSVQLPDFIGTAAFDWDDGNWPKCGAHGLSREEIEHVFRSEPAVLADPAHSIEEQRLRAIGHGIGGRYVFVVFTMRELNGAVRIRPISARYMHAKEIEKYERQRQEASRSSDG